MGAYQVVFSPYADRDLEKIVRYISRDDPEAGERLGQNLISRAFSLAESSTVHMGSQVRTRPGVRRLIEGNYLIFYRFFPDPGKVRILRFWHAARDTYRLRLNI